MRGGLARRMCSDTENSIFPPSVVVVVIGKKLPSNAAKKRPVILIWPVDSLSAAGQRTILGFVMDKGCPFT